MRKNEAYKNLSDLIFKGFLTMRFGIAGKSFVFKTVNEKEYDLIKLYSGFSDDVGYVIKFNLNFLVVSLLTVDNVNILKNRDEKFSSYYDFFSQLPSALYSKILKELLDLREVTNKVVEYIEGFSYTSFSRRRWSLTGDSPYNSSFTGISGTGGIGSNIYQDNWVLINKMLDSEESYNKDFSLSVLVASANNPKGAKSIRGKHDSAQEKSEKRRKKLALLGTMKKQAEWKPSGWASSVDTADDLVAELLRQMEGRKDKHDLFIDDYMKKLRDNAEAQTRQVEDRLKAFRERREKEGDLPAIMSSQRILTKDEVSDLNYGKHNNLVIVESEEVAGDKDKDRFLSKIGSKVLKARK